MSRTLRVGSRNPLVVLVLLASLSLLREPAFAAGTYEWDGTTNSTTTTATNWLSSSVPVFNTSSPSRLNVLNGSGNALNYTAAQGTTVFANTTGRGLVIGSTTVSGSMSISGGTFSTVGSISGDIVGNGAGSATLLIDGGTYLNSQGLTVALAAGPATFTLSSGTATVTTLTLSNSSTTSSATVNLDGGSLTATSIASGGTGTNVFNFNGGTLRAGATTTTFITGLSTANVRNGGARIDTNGNNVTIGQALLHSNVGGDSFVDGGLAKNGSGTLTLTGQNTYTGATSANAGTLATGSTGTFGSGNVAVAGGATLTLGNNISIGDLSTLTFSASSLVGMNFAGTETLGNLLDSDTGTSISAGTYDASALNTFFGASVFSGSGLLNVVAVPEPGEWMLLLSGAALLLGMRRKRRLS